MVNLNKYISYFNNCRLKCPIKRQCQTKKKKKFKYNETSIYVNQKWSNIDNFNAST